MKHELRDMLAGLMVDLKQKGIDKSFNQSSSTINDSGISHKSTTINNNNNSLIDLATKNDITNNNTTDDSHRSYMEPVMAMSNHEQEMEVISVAAVVTSTPNRTDGVSQEWLNNSAVVTLLAGHNDAICTVDSNRDILMTGR